MVIVSAFRKYVVTGVTIMSLSGAAFAGDCWLDVYAEIGFKGEHVRIDGPAKLPNLRGVAGADWSNRIDSLVVGPKAIIRAYRKEDYQDGSMAHPYHPDALKSWGISPTEADGDAEVSFGPGQRHHHLGELSFHHNINSLKIDCVK